ncbi:MAG: biopolymer transporter ExbD [Bdellovibrionales bacterium]|nr:biopolymer transporter ExbD [Bdellovibrionales bacterium]
MAHIDDGGKKGRSSNVDVNIVPFIDLMSVLVIFLLITAVWTQVSMIQIGSSIYGKKTNDDKVEPPPRAEIPFRLDIKAMGYKVLVGRQETIVPKLQNEYDMVKLISELKKIKEIYPDKMDCVVTMSDDLAYVNLIGGMDALLQSGFPQISIATGGAE